MQNLIESQSQSLKQQILLSQQEKQNHKKKRRKRIDEQGRNFTCFCGKSYLSYPALYTHTKTKHVGELKFQLKQSSKNSQLDGFSPLQAKKISNNQNNGKVSNPASQHAKQSQESEHIDNLQQFTKFIDKQFIRKKSQETLQLSKASLILSEQQQHYLQTLFQLSGAQERKNKLFLKSNQDQNIFNQKLDQIQKNQQISFYIGISNDLMKKLAASHKSILNSSISNKTKIAKINWSSEAQKNYQECEQESSDEQKSALFSLTIDQLLAKFLSEAINSFSSSQTSLHLMILKYFICHFHEQYNLKNGISSTSVDTCNKIIKFSNEFAQYLINQSSNVYIKQPIVTCKIIFYFYRWMYTNGFTNKLIQFNSARDEQPIMQKTNSKITKRGVSTCG